LPLLLWLLAAKKKKLLLQLHPHQLLLQRLLPTHLLQLPPPLHLHPLLLTPLPLPLLLQPPLLLLLPALRSNSSASQEGRRKAAFFMPVRFSRCARRASEVKPGCPGVRARYDDVFRAARQCLGQQVLDQRGPVVLHAQVRCHKMLQAPVGYRACDVRCSGV
jgi:hypothetical protein